MVRVVGLLWTPLTWWVGVPVAAGAASALGGVLVKITSVCNRLLVVPTIVTTVPLGSVLGTWLACGNTAMPLSVQPGGACSVMVAWPAGIPLNTGSGVHILTPLLLAGTVSVTVAW